MQDQLKYGNTVGDGDWLIKANSIDSWKNACVKFIRSDYGIEAHELLASHGLAPKSMSVTPVSPWWTGCCYHRVHEGITLDSHPTD